MSAPFCFVVAGSMEDVLSEAELRTILSALERAFSGRPGLVVTLHIREAAERILDAAGTPP